MTKKFNKKKSSQKMCYWCGRRATSEDHVPPKSYFEKPYKGLIKVPSCNQHNKKYAEREEWLRNYLLAFGHTDSARRLWLMKGLRSLSRKKELIMEMRTNLLNTSDGIGVKFNARKAQTVIRKIIRGLYYYHFKKILGRARFTIKMNPPDNLLQKYGKFATGYSVRHNTFNYAFAVANNNTTNGIWWLEFYNSTLFVVAILM